MTFREDGAAALEWAASYLERVGEYPVLAQVEPGDIRARLPASAPERPEPFADVLRDLDEVLLPGITHWQSPRFFAYFADRKSTRLNSSHSQISYAVFCLKKKTRTGAIGDEPETYDSRVRRALRVAPAAR